MPKLILEGQDRCSFLATKSGRLGEPLRAAAAIARFPQTIFAKNLHKKCNC